MKQTLTLVASCIWFLMTGPVYGESGGKTFIFEKGHTIDFLYLTNRANPTRTLKEYFEEVGPHARKLNFRPIGAIRIAGKPTQGNFFPDLIALGEWPGDLKARTNFLGTLLEAAPNLHSLRMDLWSAFNLTSYEIKEDTQLHLEAGKAYILTAYWMKEGSDLAPLEAALQKKVADHGGTDSLTLKDGQSLFQYEYNPDLVSITEWDDEQDAAAFAESSRGLNAMGVRHVNQFPIKAP
jgi:hypothetical protein